MITDIGDTLNFNHKICTCDDSSSLICQPNEVNEMSKIDSNKE